MIFFRCWRPTYLLGAHYSFIHSIKSHSFSNLSPFFPLSLSLSFFLLFPPVPPIGHCSFTLRVFSLFVLFSLFNHWLLVIHWEQSTRERRLTGALLSIFVIPSSPTSQFISLVSVLDGWSPNFRLSILLK